jgi:hypothetical protein
MASQDIHLYPKQHSKWQLLAPAIRKAGSDPNLYVTAGDIKGRTGIISKTFHHISIDDPDFRWTDHMYTVIHGHTPLVFPYADIDDSTPSNSTLDMVSMFIRFASPRIATMPLSPLSSIRPLIAPMLRMRNDTTWVVTTSSTPLKTSYRLYCITHVVPLSFMKALSNEFNQPWLDTSVYASTQCFRLPGSSKLSTLVLSTICDVVKVDEHGNLLRTHTSCPFEHVSDRARLSMDSIDWTSPIPAHVTNMILSALLPCFLLLASLSSATPDTKRVREQTVSRPLSSTSASNNTFGNAVYVCLFYTTRAPPCHVSDTRTGLLFRWPSSTHCYMKQATHPAVPQHKTCNSFAVLVRRSPSGITIKISCKHPKCGNGKWSTLANSGVFSTLYDTACAMY